VLAYTDMNNYRAIAISNADTKILEKLPCMTSVADCDNYQFGFKAGHSTTLCTGVFKHTVEYFVTRGSVMNSASLNLGIETYKCKPLYSIVSRPRVILRRDWLICVT